MITSEFIIKGFIIGLSISVVVGPVTILCIQRTLTHGFQKGLVTGMGSSFANCIFGVIAGISLAEITTFLISYEGIAAGIGGLILVGFGIKTLRVPLNKNKQIALENTHFKSFMSSFLISITNPMTIFLFVALYTGFEQNHLSSSYDFIIYLVMGVFLGSITWWLILSTMIEKSRAFLSEKMISVINQSSGYVLLALACYAFIRALKHLQ